MYIQYNGFYNAKISAQLNTISVWGNIFWKNGVYPFITRVHFWWLLVTQRLAKSSWFFLSFATFAHMHITALFLQIILSKWINVLYQTISWWIILLLIISKILKLSNQLTDWLSQNHVCMWLSFCISVVIMVNSALHSI